MSPSQTQLYWREWRRVWSESRRRDLELSWRDAERVRHDVHRRALGYAKSSKALSNGEFDKVLAEFRAITRPDDLRSQRAAQNQPRRRRMWVIGQRLLPALGELVEDPEGYLVSLLLDRWKTDDLGDLSDRDLSQLIMTLQKRIKVLAA